VQRFAKLGEHPRAAEYQCADTDEGRDDARAGRAGVGNHRLDDSRRAAADDRLNALGKLPGGSLITEKLPRNDRHEYDQRRQRERCVECESSAKLPCVVAQPRLVRVFYQAARNSRHVHDLLPVLAGLGGDGWLCREVYLGTVCGHVLCVWDCVSVCYADVTRCYPPLPGLPTDRRPI